MLAELEAPVKQQLHPQTDAQNGLARRRFFLDDGIQAGVSQLSGGILKSTYPGENQLVRLAQNPGIPGDGDFRSNGSQAAFQRKQVSNSIINYGNHHSTPLVEGISSA